jgi:hypothetical protein
MDRVLTRAFVEGDYATLDAVRVERDQVRQARRGALIGATLALALALLLPGSALAASTSSTTSESVTAAAAVAMTVPASVSYTMAGKTASGSIAITGVESTFATTTTLTVQPNNGGGGLFDYTKRALVVTGTGGFTFTDVPLGGWSSATTKTIASKSGDVVAGTVNVASSVQLVAPGTYTGTLTFTLAN